MHIKARKIYNQKCYYIQKQLDTHLLFETICEKQLTLMHLTFIFRLFHYSKKDNACGIRL